MSEAKQHKPDSGVLFGNSSKWIEAKEGRPDFGGEAEIQCQHCKALSRFRVAAWNNESRTSGVGFISLKFTKPEPKKGGAA